jgi:hypothetical protein
MVFSNRSRNDGISQIKDFPDFLLQNFLFLIRLMPLSDRKAGATNYPLNKILKIRFALVVCFISIFSLNNSDNLKGRAFD